MIPVDQTTFLARPGPGAGDCLRAAFASLLEVPLLAIPHFAADERDDEWMPRMLAWFRERGLYLEPVGPGVSLDAKTVGTPEGDVDLPSYGFNIAHGVGPRGFRHSVVYDGDELAHDPHPDRAGISDLDERYVFVLADAGAFVRWKVEVGA